MKSIEFSEEDFGNMNVLAQQLFSDENNPTSCNYKRILVRPKINWIKILLILVGNVVLLGVCFFASYFVSRSLIVSSVTACLVFFIFMVIYLKKTAVLMIQIYQRYAPAHIRNKCRFEPSCSEYMRLSIEKYGLVKGLKKGAGRLKRCNIDNGGFDYP